MEGALHPGAIQGKEEIKFCNLVTLIRADFSLPLSNHVFRTPTRGMAWHAFVARERERGDDEFGSLRFHHSAQGVNAVIQGDWVTIQV